ncbi:hypothetical protein TrVGV298_000711 [Trichoderma virens]|nr:hypothetical protein TrVGV298_000711 [Trichoderma virens]
MSSDGGLSMQEAISAGRAKYVARHYKLALGSFTDAIKLCPCEVEKRKRKRRDSVGQEFDQNAQANQVATEFPALECGNPLHLQALNYRAGTFEKIPDLRRALADARRMMDVAPCSPEGYLRASKILRMQENPIDSLKVLTDGILVFLERGDFQVEDLRRLDKARIPLKSKFAKVDPLSNFPSLSWMSKAHLPPELILDIFGRLELSMLCQCLRVSKSWKNALTAPACAQLWRSLLFTGASVPKKPISFDSLKKLLSYSMNNIRELVIADARKLYLDRRKFNAFLNAGTRLERLEVINPCEAVDLTRPPKYLKYLNLEGFHRFNGPNQTVDSYRRFLSAVVPNLETLILSGVPRQWFTDVQVPMMPKLRHLKLSKGKEQPWVLSVVALLKSTPQLEQLYLEDLILDCSHSIREKFDDCCVPNLKSLTIVDTRAQVFERGTNLWLAHSDSSTLEAYQLVTALNHGKKLRALEINYNWQYNNNGRASNDIFSNMHQDHAYQYEDLEILRLSNLVVSPQIAERLFESPIRSGKLYTFDICFPLPRLDEAPGQTSADHIQKYQWLEGAESIRCLGIYDFSFKAYVNALDHPLVKFLQKFPSLEEVKLGSSVSGVTEYLLTIEDVLKFVKLKSIEATQISGESFDKIRRLARKQGVNLTWEAQRPKWPMNFRDN